jgi:hypothetical protein
MAQKVSAPAVDRADAGGPASRDGTHLRTPNGSNTATVVGGWVPRERDGWMWDLTIPGNDDHDFYIDTVSADILIHNASNDCGPNNNENVPKIIRDAIDNRTYTPRPNPDGSPDIFQARRGTPLAVARKWAGAQIYDVPGPRRQAGPQLQNSDKQIRRRRLGFWPQLQ